MLVSLIVVMPSACVRSRSAAGIGHGASRWAPTCFATIMANFLDQPSGFDFNCLDTFEPPAMEV
jgi:hypothetical protein